MKYGDPIVIENVLSESDIKEAVKDIDSIAKDIPLLTDEFVERLAERGVQIAKDTVQRILYDIPDQYHNEETGWYTRTGTLKESIVSYKGESDSDTIEWIVAATAPYAWFVEHGTGISVGGSAGWQFVGSDGKLHFTQGEPPRPFMFQTAEELRKASVIREVAQEVFK